MTIDSHPEERSERKLKLAIALTLVMLVIEVVGYLISNSLALLSDAGHVLLHVVALSMSLWAIRLAAKPPSDAASFGHHKIEPLVALANVVTIIVLSFVIFYEAFNRLFSPPEIKSAEMLVIALIGFFGNLGVVILLRGPKDVNIRSAYLHVIFDTLSSVAVIAGGITILFTGLFIVDPILSFFIGGIMLFSSIGLAKESLDILLERVPKHVNIENLKSRVRGVEGVNDIHDIHIWSLCSHVHAMSAHILVDEVHVKETQEMIAKINDLLREDFSIRHSALQFECGECSVETGPK
jgi:cobalt-zinc-cadmium efflux system protein